MLETKVYIIKPEKVEKLTLWLNQLNTKTNTCTEELLYEKVFAESAYITKLGEVTLLIYSMDGLDIGPGRVNDLNTEHRQTMRDCILQPLETTQLLGQFLTEEDLKKII
jgi:hypothetical protein